MGNIIRLLPEAVANQIAAGEVVQRPASAVKELLENAIDAGSTEIKLIIRDAGKALIQVTDNGCGMSEQDARICFERHATSKIKNTNDLLAIRTLGFRGEALASIASVAQVSLRTKRVDDELGTQVEVSGSSFISQSPVSCKNGTTVSVKNLFYNVPARRNFLKSPTLELKYIIEEFFRIALVHADITLTLYNQDKILHQLHPANLKHRIIALFGQSYNQRLIPVQQETQVVQISGFIGKPEFCRKKRGEQFFFVNGRFFRNAYLNHAIESAFHDLIPKEAFPSYFIYFEVDPKTLDVNIHPTKTEVNFLEAKTIYAILQSTIKQAIGKFNLTPTLDFERESSMEIPPFPENHPITPPSISFNPDYNPFEHPSPGPRPLKSFTSSSGSWENLYDPFRESEHKRSSQPTSAELPASGQENLDLGVSEHPLPVMQIHNRYLIGSLPNGIIVVDQQHAHERILFERFMALRSDKTSPPQKLLLPVTIDVTTDDAEMLKSMNEFLWETGFDIEEFGQNTFVIHAAPSGIDPVAIAPLIESILEDGRTETNTTQDQHFQGIAKSMATRLAVKAGQSLRQEEVSALITQLLACESPELTPRGKPTMMILSYLDLEKKFKHTN